jgi:hypothetical protein
VFSVESVESAELIESVESVESVELNECSLPSLKILLYFSFRCAHVLPLSLSFSFPLSFLCVGFMPHGIVYQVLTFLSVAALSCANLICRATGCTLIIIARGSGFAALVLLVDVSLYLLSLAMRKNFVLVTKFKVALWIKILLTIILRIGLKFSTDFSNLMVVRHRT